MKLPLSWILETIHLEMPSHQIAKMLTLAGLEVDGISPFRPPFEKVVLAEVLETSKHPEADRLKVALVTDGSQSYSVVCGASNCRAGLKTALALVGATLMDEKGELFKVKKTKLRGIESHGMLCSEKELGLGENDEGIIEFAPHMKVGEDVAQIYEDSLFEISMTPNLGHCASVLGVARELSAASGKPFILPKVSFEKESVQSTEKNIKVFVEDFEKCPRYACRIIKGVKIGPSPAWLQKRLIACDVRPVNNVVDITNYVLMEMGHPLHAFDYDRLDQHEIHVRCAKEGETFVTLDGKKRELKASDLMICDGCKPIALAGIMGGLNSEVSSSTSNVLLESAYFYPTSIRRTSKRLGLQTEASRRFERGVDPNNAILALDRAAFLMQELVDGEVYQGIVDVKKTSFSPKQIPCRLSRVHQILGVQLSVGEVESIFHRLEMETVWDGKDQWMVTVPTYRVDIQAEIDLIEEVARINGFENIPKGHPRYITSQLSHAPIFLFEKEVHSRLVAEGLQEFLTCDLIGPSLLHRIGEEDLNEENVVRVVNPTSIEQSVLRTSLLPGLLQAAKFNFDRECRDLSVFELGRVHFKEGEQYKEQSVAGILLMGRPFPQNWEEEKKEVNFFLLKGMIENLFQELGVTQWALKKGEKSVFHPGRQGIFYIDDLEVGVIGEVHPAIGRRFDICQRIYFSEIDLHALFQARSRENLLEKKRGDIPVYPASDRDLTLTLLQEVAVQDVLDSIRKIASPLLEKVMVIAIYQNEKIGKENKNVTFRFVYRDGNKTVAQEEVDAEHGRIVSFLQTIGGTYA